jgi:hypothetical protein
MERNPDGTPKGYPCCDRCFPDPDPLFRFIDYAEGPSAFWQLPRDERSRRLRLYLLAIASGTDPLLAWMVALDFTPETIRDIHHLIDVENADDARLLGLIEQGAHPPDRIVRFTPDGWRPG